MNEEVEEKGSKYIKLLLSFFSLIATLEASKLFVTEDNWRLVIYTTLILAWAQLIFLYYKIWNMLKQSYELILFRSLTILSIGFCLYLLFASINLLTLKELPTTTGACRLSAEFSKNEWFYKLHLDNDHIGIGLNKETFHSLLKKDQYLISTGKSILYPCEKPSISIKQIPYFGIILKYELF